MRKEIVKPNIAKGRRSESPDRLETTRLWEELSCCPHFGNMDLRTEWATRSSFSSRRDAFVPTGYMV